MGLGVAEVVILLIICCGLPAMFLLGGGLVFALIRWGVIAGHWVKGEAPTQLDGDYTLDQSQNVAEE